MKIQKNNIYNIDCLEGMKHIEDKSIDMILCDLPYGVTQNKWDIIIPFCKLWKQYKRIIKDNGAIVLFSMQPFTSLLVISNWRWFKQELIWCKNNGGNFMNTDIMHLQRHENIIVFGKGKITYNPQVSEGHKPTNTYTKNTSDGDNYGKTKKGFKGGGSTKRHPTTLLFYKVVNGNSKDKVEHPNQKPVSLIKYLIKTYSNQGEVILDNCSGSGTTAEGAIATYRDFICFEKEKKYYDISVRRLSAVQLELEI